MILNLKNNLFNIDPLVIYKEQGISTKEWNVIWYKRKFLDYQINELSEYIKIVFKKNINCKQLSRYLMRYELYILTQSIIKKEETIHISFYPKHIISFIKDYYHE